MAGVTSQSKSRQSRPRWPPSILLDINLPDGAGLDVLRQIRQRQPEAVAIMITANVLIDEIIAALRGGAYDFTGKPINLEELGSDSQRHRSQPFA